MGNSAITGGITSPSLQSDQAIGTTSSPTTSSTSYTDLEEMSITMTTGANPVLIKFSGTFTKADTNEIWIIIDIDGTDKDESERVHKSFTATEFFTLDTSWLETMTAGSHTFKIQWRVNAGTDATAHGVKRAMQVIELR